MPSLSLRSVLVLVSGFVVVAFPFLYFGNYSGDAQLYLIYGENAAGGSFFEFNPGDKSPGVTGTAWMLFIAAAFDLAPDSLVPLVIKFATILCWFGSLVFVFLVAKMLLRSISWAWATAVVSGVIPGSVYNSTIGMETALFFLVVWVWIYLALRWKWFAASSPVDIRGELVLGTVLGLTCWVRPEGFILAAVALSYRAVFSFQSRHEFSLALRRSITFLMPFLLVTGGLAAFNYIQSGYVFPASGVARVLMSHLASDSYQIGPLFISSKFAIRLSAYFPLVVLWLISAWLFIRGRGILQESRVDIGFLIFVFITFFVLYSTFLSAVHLSRYIVFVLPSVVIVGAFAARWLWSFQLSTGHRFVELAPRIGLVGLVIVLAAVFSYETNLRTKLDSDASLWRTMEAPKERESFSNALFDRVGQPENLPISIALQEVQIRYWLDDRFVVNSLDGRTDPLLLDYASSNGIDHIGYLKARDVRFLLDTPSYNKDSQAWSLLDLNSLEANDTTDHAGLTFTRLPVEPRGPIDDRGTGPKSWVWFEGADGVSMLYWFLEILSFADYPELDATIISVHENSAS